jgi:hypothetical protein
MLFTQKTLNAFEMAGRMAACEIPATTPAHRAFIGIYPPSDKKHHWLIRRFEVPERVVGEFFGEEDIHDNRYLRLTTLEEVEAILLSWSVDPATLDAPWESDYPL